MTKQELEDAIIETEIQEQMFRLANNEYKCAEWILERVRLRGILFNLLMSEIR